jgi:chloramphenicol-sensitive protein RarD
MCELVLIFMRFHLLILYLRTAMKISKHYLAAMLAFTMWGFFSIPLKALAGYLPGSILYYRIVFSVLILFFLLIFFRRKSIAESYRHFTLQAYGKKWLLVVLTLAGGALLTINWLTFIHIVNHINVKTAAFSYLVCPVLTALLGVWLLKESLTGLQWFAVLLCVVSCLLIGLNSWVELGFSFLTALTYALYLISQRKNQGFDRLLVLGIQILFALVVLTFLPTGIVVNSPSSFYLLTALIAVFFTVIPLFLNLYALNQVNAATIGLLMYINPLLNFALAVFWFKESVSTMQALGYTLVFIALVVFNLKWILKKSYQLN